MRGLNTEMSLRCSCSQTCEAVGQDNRSYSAALPSPPVVWRLAFGPLCDQIERRRSQPRQGSVRGGRLGRDWCPRWHGACALAAVHLSCGTNTHTHAHTHIHTNSPSLRRQTEYTECQLQGHLEKLRRNKWAWPHPVLVRAVCLDSRSSPGAHQDPLGLSRQARPGPRPGPNTGPLELRWRGTRRRKRRRRKRDRAWCFFRAPWLFGETRAECPSPGNHHGAVGMWWQRAEHPEVSRAQGEAGRAPRSPRPPTAVYLLSCCGKSPDIC